MMKSRTKVWLIVLIAVPIAAGLAYYKFFSAKEIPPGKKEAPRLSTVPAPDHTAKAEVKTVTDWYEAVGTVRPRTETSIESQVTGQVLDVRVNPGDKVEEGQTLVMLDSRQLTSRLDQAKQGLASARAKQRQGEQAVQAAKAAFDQAASDYNRIKKYYESQAATEQELEKARAAYLRAQAELKSAQEAMQEIKAGIRRAQEVVREAEIAQGYAKIQAPAGGEVLKRMVEPGDLAVPGKPLIVLQTTGALRLEAHVREGLIKLVEVGENLPVTFPTIDSSVEAKVEEIVPYADPQTRTFLVKAALPELSGIYPGMFGKLRIPAQQVKVVLIPRKTVRVVGQLEMVEVETASGWENRYIKTGKQYDDRVEVLSGLSGDELLGY